jgi:hypothetical protein
LAVAGDSAGVAPDLDPVGIMQADEHRPAPVAGDDPAVGFTQFIESLPPRPDIGTKGTARALGSKPVNRVFERHRIKPVVEETHRPG